MRAIREPDNSTVRIAILRDAIPPIASPFYQNTFLPLNLPSKHLLLRLKLLFIQYVPIPKCQTRLV